MLEEWKSHALIPLSESRNLVFLPGHGRTQQSLPDASRHSSSSFLYLKDHGGYYVDTGLTQVSAKLRAVSQVQLMDLVSER